MLVVDEVEDSTAPGWRVPHQPADEPQAPRVVPLPEQKAKMRASRPSRARLEEPSCSAEGDHVLRIAQRAEFEPNARPQPLSDRCRAPEATEGLPQKLRRVVALLTRLVSPRCHPALEQTKAPSRH